MKKTMFLAAIAITVNWAADVNTQPSSTMQGNMRQMPMFEQFDLNHDGKISQTEFGEFRAERLSERAQQGKMLRNESNAPVFSQMDTDKDGFVSKEEFQKHRMERMSIQPNGMMQGQGMGMGKNRMRQMPSFADYDLNNDGKVTQNEFDEAREKRMSQRAKEGKMMRNAGNAPTFSQIDANQDGIISPDEFKAHQIKQMKKRPTAKQLQDRIINTFTRIDTDHSGQVSLDEFKAYRMQQIQNHKKCRIQIEGTNCIGMGMGKNRMRQMPSFADYDLNNDGKVTQNEFEEARAKRMEQRAKEGKMMRNAGNAPTFLQIDANQDGIISPDEFKAHQMEQMNNPQKGMMPVQGMKCSASN